MGARTVRLVGIDSGPRKHKGCGDGQNNRIPKDGSSQQGGMDHDRTHLSTAQVDLWVRHRRRHIPDRCALCRCDYAGTMGPGPRENDRSGADSRHHDVGHEHGEPGKGSSRCAAGGCGVRHRRGIVPRYGEIHRHEAGMPGDPGADDDRRGCRRNTDHRHTPGGAGDLYRLCAR